ncbi:hypothetical protein I549_0947 [Mycobacterium avium subsp. avium 2285 (R)]|nr:hypothetical protein I549_0947 [Mycobacterium avium subsp. avium 2285 (R)]
MSAAATDWGGSGLAYLTGLPDGPADFSRAPCCPGAPGGGGHRGPAGRRRRRGGPAERAAALLGLRRAGQVSPGGATRLLAARDDHCALTLSRADDLAAVPALLQVDDMAGDPWPALRCWAAGRATAEIVERATLLDIPRRRWARRARPPNASSRSHRAARRVRRAACWSPTCLRCGPARCAGSCWPVPGPPSSRWKARAAPTAPGPGTGPSSTG